MPLEPYPYPREITMAQAATKTAAFSQAEVNNVGGAYWTLQRRTRGTGAGSPAVVTTQTHVGPLWVYKGEWQLPGGVDQTSEGYRWMSDLDVDARIDDQLTSEVDEHLRFVLLSIEHETDYHEGRARQLP